MRIFVGMELPTRFRGVCGFWIVHSIGALLVRVGFGIASSIESSWSRSGDIIVSYELIYLSKDRTDCECSVRRLRSGDNDLLGR